MDKKKGIFFGAIIIDIILIYLAYLVFYEKLFDESISVILTWIVIIGITFMVIITIGLAIAIPRKRTIKCRRKLPKKEIPPEKLAEFTPIEDEETPEDNSVKEEKAHDLEYLPSDSGIVKIRRVAKEDLDEIKEHVNDEKIDFKDEMQKVIDARTREVEGRVDELISNRQTSKMEKNEKLVSQNETIKPLKQKIRGELITNEEKIYNYMKEHPDAAPSEVRKAVGCKPSSAKRYRSLWLKNEGN